MTETALSRPPAVILSGGKSARMGAPKALLTFGKARLVDHVAARIRPHVSRIFLNANDPAITLAGAAALPDSVEGFQGPLAGVHAGLTHVRRVLPEATHVLMLPVDCPFFPRNVVDRLSGTLAGPDDVALAASGGRMHPVLGLWPVTLVGRLAAWLDDPPTLKVRAFLDGEPLRVTEYQMIDTRLGPLDPFFNVNTPDDLALALRLLEEVDP